LFVHHLAIAFRGGLFLFLRKVHAMNQIDLNHAAGCEVVRGAKAVNPVESLLNPRGAFVVEHWRDGKLLGTYRFPNGITNEGKNKLLNVMFHSTTAITAWYLGLIDNASYTALAATDDYVDINQAADQWKEFTTYNDDANGSSSTTRPAWGVGASSGQSVTNASAAVFDITTGGTVKGVFLCGGISGCQTKNDHAAGGCLWATALFTSGDVTVSNGDQLKVTYTVSA
jgi:hypothetical protein